MTFEPKKFDQIYTDMMQRSQDQLPGVTDFSVGSVVRTMYESFAYEIAVLYEQMHQVYLSAFVDTATGQQLEQVVAILGIHRGLPDFAEGMVTFERDPGGKAIEIPVGTLVTTEDTEKSPKKAFQTIEVMTVEADQTEATVRVQAVERGDAQAVAAEAITVMPQPIPGIKSVINREPIQFTGKRLESDPELRRRAKNLLLASGRASRTALETALLSLPGVRDVKLQEHFDVERSEGSEDSGGSARLGLVDIFVDGIDFEDAPRVQFLQHQIDRVRAAGVFVCLQPAISLEISAVFRLEVDGSLQPEDLSTLEEQVQQTLTTYINELPMGQPLTFSKLIQRVLSLQLRGLNGLEEFAIALSPPQPAHPDPYQFQDRQIPASGAEEFTVKHLQVATHVHPVPVQISVQTAGGGDTEPPQTVRSRLLSHLQSYFKELEPGQAIPRQRLQEILQTVGGLQADTLEMAVQNWSPLTQVQRDRIVVSPAEQLQLDEDRLFVYQQRLGLTGALRFTPVPGLSSERRQALRQVLSEQLARYLQALPPGAPIDLQVVRQLGQIPDVASLDVTPEDFRLQLGSEEIVRLEKSQIPINEFEKVVLGAALVSDTLVPVEVTLTALSLRLIPPAVPQAENVNLQDASSQAREAARAVRDSLGSLSDFDRAAAIALLNARIPEA
ncbi:MAG TPA: baseplate J/gp47 family protein, partial [Trichocoleus sp.]